MTETHSYDFSSSPGLAGQAHHAVTAAMAVAVPRAGLLLSSMLRRPVTATASDPEAVVLAELEGPSGPQSGGQSGGRTLFRIDPRGVAVMPNAHVTALADAMMGGPGTPDEREPANLETRLVANNLTRALRPLSEVLADLGVAPLRLEPVGPGATGAEGSLLRVIIRIEVGEVEADLTLAFPAGLFAAEGTTDAVPMATPEVDAALRGVPVTCAVRFSPIAMCADDLQDLAVGDVIRLDHPVGQPLVGEVEGKPLFLAQPGRAGRRVAVEVLDLLEGSVR